MQNALEKIEPAEIRGLKQLFYNPMGLQKFRIEQELLIVGWAEGANAGGMIGPEMNGIFIVDCNRSQVVADQLSNGQLRPHEIEKICLTTEMISQMTSQEFSQMLSEHHDRVRYNPVEQTGAAARVKDLKIALKGKFTKVVRDLERLIVSRRVSADLGREKFTRRLYQFFTLRCGHIAHYNQEGFYSAQLQDIVDFNENLDRLGRGVCHFGGSLELRPDFEGDSMSRITKEIRTIVNAYR